MRKARKPLCLLLCAVLLLSMSAAALGANNNYSSWFQTNYDEINKLGLMPASFNGLDLTKDITRGEMCELAVVAFEKATGNVIDELERTDYFTDTTDKNILKAYEYGIVSGYPDGSFRPDQQITRAETVTMINRVLERVPAKESRLLSRSIMLTFPDNNPGDWYYIAIQEASNSHEYQRSVYETSGDEMWTKLIDNVDWTKLEK